MPLNKPPAGFSKLLLHIREVSVTSLKRIGRRNVGEPYFGRHAVNRFDDPDKQFGTCYCGQHLDTAIAESLLHDEIPENGLFKIRQEDIDSRYVVTYDAADDAGRLRLADLTGRHLKRLGGDNSLSADYPYEVAQQWSASVHAHPANVDGLVYVSKQLNDKQAIVVFDRAKAKFGCPVYVPLRKIRGLTQAQKRLGIVVIGVNAKST
ncbi:RES family NAD+ phosphorylase [Comamonadaceae bacterium PP-2]